MPIGKGISFYVLNIVCDEVKLHMIGNIWFLSS
jgi:hypothetical protein